MKLVLLSHLEIVKDVKKEIYVEVQQDNVGWGQHYLVLNKTST